MAFSPRSARVYRTPARMRARCTTAGKFKSILGAEPAPDADTPVKPSSTSTDNNNLAMPNTPK